jgi:hypothetical protein
MRLIFSQPPNWPEKLEITKKSLFLSIITGALVWLLA